MASALDLITNAVQGIGVYAPGEPLRAEDTALGLQELNTMLDSWSNEALMTYAILEQSGLLIPGQYQYTVGTSGGASFPVQRPLGILDSPGSCYVLDSNGNRYNLEVLPRDRWNLIGNIAQVTSNFPNRLFYDPQFPLGVINLYPIPNQGWTLYWDSNLQLVDFANPAQQMSLPPGYQKAIQDNLRLMLWPYFKPDAVRVPPVLVKLAAESKGNIKRTNLRINIANYDPELVSRANGTYNIYTDSNRRGGGQ
jgi:hypothetical protein